MVCKQYRCITDKNGEIVNMAEVTVAQLASVIGAPVDRLLKQMNEAGLPQKTGSQKVSDSEKQTLLLFLKKSHGQAEAAPKKITLKRKVTTTLSNSGTSSSVNIEVRNKRQIVKADAPKADVKSGNQKSAPKNVSDKPASAKPSSAPRGPADAVAESSEHDKKPKRNFTTPLATPKTDGDDDSPKKKVSRRGAEKAREEKSLRNLKQYAEKKLQEESLEEREIRRRREKRQGKRVLSSAGDHQFEKPAGPVVNEVMIGETITVSDLAQQMAVKATQVIKVLMKMGSMVTINQSIDQDTAILVVEEMGHKVKGLVKEDAIEDEIIEELQYTGARLSRAPVITVMGHVDHGKTSLLDYIRKTKVVSGESGGITQHIGAYSVDTGHGKLTFLDTPGHAAFTAMRARGAKATDIVILVVAADDGVMPQTIEAINHAKAAGVPIVVAINKMDKEAADPERVKSELGARDVIPEDWGGDVPFMPVSAHTGEGINELLDAVLLQSEMLELGAVIDGPGSGVVIESRLDKGRGPVATVLVQQGTLKHGDIILAGTEYGRVRALVSDTGAQVKTAGPSIPVEVLGLGGVPNAGDEFLVVKDDKRAREVAEFRDVKARQDAHSRQQGLKLDEMFASMGTAEKRILNVVLKTDVRGSLEALSSALMQIGNDEVEVRIVSSGVGGITETDASLAASSKAVIFGFNVRASGGAKEIIEKNGIDLRYYSIIYNIIDDVRQALSGMLSPELRESILGVAQVREVFTSPKFGLIAGSMVIEGTIHRNKKIRVLRADVVIYEGELESLRRFKDDVLEVRNGMECGIGVKNYTDVQANDRIEVFEVKEVARSL